MRKSLIIGAGQLGSRHLQGLVKSTEMIEIYVLDPSAESLRISEEREKEITHTHKIVYSQVWEILPKSFDLVIIATSSNIRETIISKLLNNHKVTFLVLEKILFQELEAYRRVSDLLIENNVITYVNHPRRMFESYKFLKTNIKENKRNIYTIVGGNWGLGCNALHFLDLFVYLSGNKIQDINISLIDDEIIESSRKGFIEFTGTLTGHLMDGSFFNVTSFKGDSSAITLSVFNDEQRFIIQEGGTPQIYMLEKTKLFSQENFNFKVQYQSELTMNIALQLLKNNSCTLPTFQEARHSHELFLKAMLEKYNKISGLKATILPIT